MSESTPVRRSAALELAARVLRTEAATVASLVDRLDARVEQAVALLAGCRSRVIVPAFFVHPAEGAVQGHRITSVPVVSDDGRPVGVLHIHDLWRTESF